MSLTITELDQSKTFWVNLDNVKYGITWDGKLVDSLNRNVTGYKKVIVSAALESSRLSQLSEEFSAQQKADIDWELVGSNDNPYTKNQVVARKAYDDRFEQIRFEWEQFTGSVA
jgi:hypothetical protein|tara:strand:- start:42 stop:383 length:342 start_codon:yes stop_codon:yes gene_type:complete